MKVFAYGYSPGHGTMDSLHARAWAYQGDMMLRALISDLGSLPDMEIVTLRDPHVPALDLLRSVVVVPCDRPFEERFAECVRMADAVWPIAPESAGMLERLSRRVVRGKRILLGSRPSTVRLAASKRLTAQALAAAGIGVVDTYLADDEIAVTADAWVVKPDDGAGCLDTHIFNDLHKARAWLRAPGRKGYVLQPFVAGRSCSLSMLCCDGVAEVLSFDQHRIAVRNNQFHDLGCTVNGMADVSGACKELARQIAAAMPGLWGCASIDFILTPQGAVVLEVNPRIGASYIGLHASIGCNPAGLVVDLLGGMTAERSPAFRADVVSVATDAFSAHG